MKNVRFTMYWPIRDELSSDWLQRSAESAHSQPAQAETADPAIRALPLGLPFSRSLTLISPKRLWSFSSDSKFE